MMQDVPHLIQSELAGLAFSSLQSIFRKVDIKIALTLPLLAHIEYNKIYVTIDPAAGGAESHYAIISMTRHRGNVQILGAEHLNTKDVTKQFALVEAHVERLRNLPAYTHSEIYIIVERNLGNEAEHHKIALQHLSGVKWHVDYAARRVGFLTTQDSKYAMATLTNLMLREQRLSFLNPLISEKPEELRKSITQQLQNYSVQFKDASDAFGKTRQAISGKIGGMQDDLCIALQLGVYVSSKEANK